jgi:hypothetical protein
MQQQPNLDSHDADNGAVSEPAGETREQPESVKEYGGPRGLEPTRYGDWEKNGRCIDF